MLIIAAHVPEGDAIDQRLAKRAKIAYKGGGVKNDADVKKYEALKVGVQ